MQGRSADGILDGLSGQVSRKRKTLRVIQALLRGDEPYCDPGVDYERLLVERNAPRWLRKPKKYGFVAEQPSRYAAPAN